MVIAMNFFQIYNVCDGIAQCEDLSDEGPEVRVARRRNQTFIIISALILLSVPNHNPDGTKDNSDWSREPTED